MMEQTRAELARGLGIEDPPDVAVIREIDYDEKQQVMDACLNEAGFPANGDYTYEIPPGQDSVFNLAMYTCLLQYPYPREYSRPWGREQIRMQYHWTVDFVIPCLEAEGYSVGGTIPSESTFIDTWETDPYYPYADIGGFASAQEDIRVNAACPQTAMGSVLFGDETIDQWKARTGR